MELDLDQIKNVTRNLFRIKYHKLFHGVPCWINHPMNIMFDTHNYCNASCIYCNVQHCNEWGTKKGTLPTETVDYVLKYFGERHIPINHVSFYINGDGLLEKRLGTFTKLAKKYLKTETVTFSNAIAYENRHLLLDKNLNRVHFTFSAATPETYKIVHGVDKFHTALKTIMWFKEHKRSNQKVIVNFVQTKQNFDELSEWKKIFAGFDWGIRPLHLGVGQESSNNVYSEEVVPKKNVYRLEKPCACFATLPISFDGKIMQCCDTPYKYNWGDVKENDILTVWKKRVEVALNHPACKLCNQVDPNWRKTFEKYGEIVDVLE